MRRLTVILTLVIVLLAPGVAHALRYPPSNSHMTHSQLKHWRIIRATAKAYGVKKADRRAMKIIGWRESGYNPYCVTGSCKGAFQLMTSVSRKKWANIRWNTRKATRYVRHRYGSWRGALAHSNSHGWY